MKVMCDVAGEELVPAMLADVVLADFLAIEVNDGRFVGGTDTERELLVLRQCVDGKMPAVPRDAVVVIALLFPELFDLDLVPVRIVEVAREDALVDAGLVGVGAEAQRRRGDRG